MLFWSSVQDMLGTLPAEEQAELLTLVARAAVADLKPEGAEDPAP